MTGSFTIAAAVTQADVEDAARLFAHYASTLPVDLGYQDFQSEVSCLPGRYAAPGGAILIARNPGHDAVGCVAIRPLGQTGICEMKRLFILPSARGTGLGRALTEAAIQHARLIGYMEIRLDTLPTMKSAIGLYQRLGFERCADYYAPTPAGTIFMGLCL